MGKLYVVCRKFLNVMYERLTVSQMPFLVVILHTYPTVKSDTHIHSLSSVCLCGWGSRVLGYWRLRTVLLFLDIIYAHFWRFIVLLRNFNHMVEAGVLYVPNMLRY